MQFCEDSFRDESDPPDPRYERGCRHAVEVEGKHYVVDALEMPSKNLSANPMLEQAVNITDGAVLVYDVRDPATLAHARGIQEFIRDSVGTREYGLLLVGNKSDSSADERRVSPTEGAGAAAGFRIQCAFVEVSAKSGEGVPVVFPALAKEIMRTKRLNQQRKEEAEKNALLKIKNQTSAKGPLRSRLRLWKTLRNPFLRR